MRDAAEARARLKTLVRDIEERQDRWGLEVADAYVMLEKLKEIIPMMTRPDRFYAECPMCGADVEHQQGDRSAQCHVCGEVLDLTVPAYETEKRP